MRKSGSIAPPLEFQSVRCGPLEAAESAFREALEALYPFAIASVGLVAAQAACARDIADLIRDQACSD